MSFWLVKVVPDRKGNPKGFRVCSASRKTGFAAGVDFVCRFFLIAAVVVIGVGIFEYLSHL